MSNRATFAYLTRLQKEIGFKFLPPDFRTMMRKCLNVYMTSLEAEFVQFKVLSKRYCQAQVLEQDLELDLEGEWEVDS